MLIHELERRWYEDFVAKLVISRAEYCLKYYNTSTNPLKVIAIPIEYFFCIHYTFVCSVATL